MSGASTAAAETAPPTDPTDLAIDPATDAVAPVAEAPAKVQKTRVFRAPRVAMPALEAARQARVASLAWTVFRSRERVMEFLNEDNAQLGARPLALAIGSAEGLARVEALLTDIGSRESAA